MYLDAKHHITKDLRDWSTKRKMPKAIAEVGKRLGDYWTLYHAIEFLDPELEAFWFEGRSWKYGEVRREADKLAQWFLDQGVKTKGMSLLSPQGSGEI